MAHPIIELRRLLGMPSSKVSGTVSKIEGTNVYVSTAKGTVLATKKDITEYRVGDRVSLRGGELAGRLPSEADVPVFFI